MGSDVGFGDGLSVGLNDGLNVGLDVGLSDGLDVGLPVVGLPVAVDDTNDGLSE